MLLQAVYFNPFNYKKHCKKHKNMLFSIYNGG